MLSCDYYLMPKSIHEAFDLMDVNRDNFKLIAGGTDLLPWAREGNGGDVHCPVLIDLSLVPELTGVEFCDGRVRLGANTTIQQFLVNPVLQAQMPVMQRCAAWFADQQIREQATIGGNIVNASPAADSVPPIMAMDGTVTLVSRQGEDLHTREIPIAEFIVGPGKNALQDCEILTGIECNATSGYGSAFKKVGHRRSLVVSVVCAAALVKVDAARRNFEEVRIAFGGIGPVPLRLRNIESALVGQPVSLETIRQMAAEIPADTVRSRSRQEYRREVVHNFFVEALTEALADLGLSVGEKGISEEVAHV